MVSTMMMSLIFNLACNGGKIEVSAGDSEGATVTWGDSGDSTFTPPTPSAIGGGELLEGYGYQVLRMENDKYCASDVVANGNAGEVVCVQVGSSTGGESGFLPVDYITTIQGESIDDYLGIYMNLINDGEHAVFGAEGYNSGTWQGRSYGEDVASILASTGTNNVGTLMTDIIYDGSALSNNSYYGKSMWADIDKDGHEDLVITRTSDGEVYVNKGTGADFIGTYTPIGADFTLSAAGDTSPGFRMAANGVYAVFSTPNESSVKNKNGAAYFYQLPLTPGMSMDYPMLGDKNDGQMGVSITTVDNTLGAQFVVGEPGRHQIHVVDGNDPSISTTIQKPSGTNDGFGEAVTSCQAHTGDWYVMVGAPFMLNSKGTTTGGVYIYGVTSGVMDTYPTAIYTPPDDYSKCGGRLACGADGADTHWAVACQTGAYSYDTVFFGWNPPS